MSSSQQLSVKRDHSQFLITPQSITEAMEYAKMIANSSFCPKGMNGKPGDVLVAVQMGAEVGLSPMQALQNIAVINGRPCIWGDAALALVQASPHYISHKEWEETTADGMFAYCEVTRRGSEPYIKCFSEKDAKKANLWGKAGPWTQYPSRMLQMRARSFALRDKFADALKGLNIREEVEDYQDEIIRPKVVPIVTKQKVSQMITQEPESDPVEYDHDVFMEAVSEINACKNEDELRTVFTKAYKNPKIVCNLQAKNNLVKVKDERKLKLGQEEFLAEYDGETGEVVEPTQEVAS